MENKNENRKTAIIIGAGPAGLTAAYRLLTETDIKPIVLEGSPYISAVFRAPPLWTATVWISADTDFSPKTRR